MKRILKWIGIGLLALAGILVVVGLILHFRGQSRMNQAPEIATRPVTVPTDAEAVAHGEHLVNSVSSCRLCHGDQLEGDVLIDGELGMYVPAPNLTSGAGGIGAAYSDADWERAIRHGVGGDGHVLAIMPSQIFQHYSDQDLGDLIAYLKTIPPVDHELGPRRMGFPASVLLNGPPFNDLTHINAIDHANVGGEAPPVGATAAYGQYLVSIAACSECHGENLAGVVLAEGEDGPPEGPNLTPGGELSGWSEADFMNALHNGQTPSGKELDPEEMPWQSLGQMSDTELQAIWAYLSSLPPLPTNEAGSSG